MRCIVFFFFEKTYIEQKTKQVFVLYVFWCYIYKLLCMPCCLCAYVCLYSFCVVFYCMFSLLLLHIHTCTHTQTKHVLLFQIFYFKYIVWLFVFCVSCVCVFVVFVMHFIVWFFIVCFIVYQKITQTQTTTCFYCVYIDIWFCFYF